MLTSIWKTIKRWLIAKETPVPKSPPDLRQAIKELYRIISQGDQFAIRTGKANVSKFHHTLGRWLRNNWGLWEGSELAQWFNKQGIRHADDMSGIILSAFQAELRGEPFDLDAKIQDYRTYWKENGVDPDTMNPIVKQGH